MDPDLLPRLVRYADLSGFPAFAAFGVRESAVDRLLADAAGVDPSVVTGLRADLDELVLDAADALLTDPAVTDRVAALDLAPGERIVVVGDSLSADRLSWARILVELVGRMHPQVSVEVLALSGRTTGDALALAPVLISRRPTRVLVLLGTNDIRREGASAAVPMVSAWETGRNLHALKALLETEVRARVRLIVPPPMDPERSTSTRFLTGEFWDAADLPRLAATVRDVDRTAIDLASVPVGPEFWEDDGVHPGPDGQITVLRAILAQL
ncbi:SGNH/GDSL hydrolase family protein [Pseudonocardia phyllosphaerae]|uniref:SGNH/GDSL hydrolase family protein n=1 Tax=Pseudonocardia phyllosphaerae TaxID=3390502 RepID=UPI003978A053